MNKRLATTSPVLCCHSRPHGFPLAPMRAVHATAGLIARQLDSASSRPHRPTSVQASFKSSPADKKMSFSRGASRARVGVVSRASLSPETAENVVMQISGVIKFGAPMYNKGDARGCARLYRQTALSIARDASVTSQEIRDILRDAVAKGDEIARDAAETDPMGGEEDQATQERVAWALRRGLDRVVDLIMDPPTDEPEVFRPSSTDDSNQPDEEKMGDDSEGSKSAAPRTPTITATTAALFDFAKTPDLAGRWRSLNDGVMGGRSNGAVAFADAAMQFTGDVVTAGGGFTSVRLPLAGDELTGSASLVLRVRADERSYGLTLADSAQAGRRAISHGADITTDGPTDTNGWQIVDLSYAELQPSIFGQSLDAPPFDPDLAIEIGIIISDGIDGPFALEVDWIDACRGQ